MTGSRPPAIRQTVGNRPDLLIFEIVDEIHAADIEQMARAVEAAIRNFDVIDILLLFDAFEGATLGALVDSSGIRAGLRSNSHVRRYGVVGAPVFAKMLIKLFDPLTPVDARTFEADQIDQAHTWMNSAHDATDRTSQGRGS